MRGSSAHRPTRRANARCATLDVRNTRTTRHIGHKLCVRVTAVKERGAVARLTRDSAHGATFRCAPPNLTKPELRASPGPNNASLASAAVTVTPASQSRGRSLEQRDDVQQSHEPRSTRPRARGCCDAVVIARSTPRLVAGAAGHTRTHGANRAADPARSILRPWWSHHPSLARRGPDVVVTMRRPLL